MDTITKEIVDHLQDGSIRNLTHNVDMLYIEGYITHEEFKKAVLSEGYTPKVTGTRDPFPECLHTESSRRQITLDKEQLRDLDLNFFA